MTKKISEVASVGQLSDAEYLLGVDSAGKIIKVEKQKAYPIATTEKNGLMSTGDKGIVSRYRHLVDYSKSSYGWVKAYEIPPGKSVYLLVFQPTFSEQALTSTVVVEVLLHYKIDGTVYYNVIKKGKSAHPMINNSCSIAYKIENNVLFLYFPLYFTHGVYEQLIFNQGANKTEVYYSYADLQDLTLIPASGGVSS